MSKGDFTGSKGNMRPRPPVRTNAADTSRDAERIISRPPMPFENPFGPANVAAPKGYSGSGRDYAGVNSPGARGKAGGYSAQNIGCANTSLTPDEMAAIGYGPNATKSENPIISGHPTRNNPRRAGMPGTRNASGGKLRGGR